MIASWSSGSSALTGFLHHCGAYACPPHQQTNDIRTPSSFEPFHYARELRKLFDEFSFRKKGNMEEFKNFFDKFWKEETQKAFKAGFTSIVLKHPLQVLIMPYLNNRLQPLFVFCTRPFNEIESSRKRRKWHPVYGEYGAKKLNSIAVEYLIANSCPYFSISYYSLVHDNSVRNKLLHFCGLEPNIHMLNNAESFLNKPVK